MRREDVFSRKKIKILAELVSPKEETEVDLEDPDATAGLEGAGADPEDLIEEADQEQVVRLERGGDRGTGGTGHHQD